uniref:Uncharacterized protein n=1 Tax=Arion vulgaris TaxID=1028688 RepID=A0A0B7B3Q8_9EUPU
MTQSNFSPWKLHIYLLTLYTCNTIKAHFYPLIVFFVAGVFAVCGLSAMLCPRWRLT